MSSPPDETRGTKQKNNANDAKASATNVEAKGTSRNAAPEHLRKLSNRS
jgi:hypothetical protein